MQINESKRHEEVEEKDKFQRRNSKLTNIFSNTHSKRFNNNNNFSTNISDKEKRTILEHYRNLYSFKKKINKNIEIENNNNNIDNNNNGFFPNLTSKTNSFANFQSEKSKKINSAEKNSMFRSSIYYNLLSKEPLSNSNSNSNLNSENLRIIKTEKNENKNSNKGNASQTSYGPFLNINTNFHKEIVIENPLIKRSLEDINYYGPYFSHCPICKNRNLEFYQTMEPHQCLKLLNYIKKKRSKIQVK